MLTSKPRPVPSKAALKVLYQLAYISSGTVVGVAALCAEERRRRTQIVQRIAENAKKIRQSPRYYQNAALAVQEAKEDIVGSGGLEWVEPYREDGEEPDHRKAQSRRLTGNPEAAVRGPELPSAVEAGYAQVRVQLVEHTRSEDRTSPQKGSSKPSSDGLEAQAVFAVSAETKMRRDTAQASRLRSAPNRPSHAHDLLAYEKSPARASQPYKAQRPGPDQRSRQPAGSLAAPSAMEAPSKGNGHRASRSVAPASGLRSGGVDVRMSTPRGGRENVKEGLKVDLTRSWPAKPMTSWLQGRCRELLAEARIHEAAELILELQKDHHDSMDFRDLVRACFDAALAAGSLSACRKLLEPLEDVSSNAEIQACHDAFLQLCDATGSYSLILELFGESKPSSRSRATLKSRSRYLLRSTATGKSERSNEIIAYAITKIPADQMTSKLTEHFTDHFRRVPPAMRARIIESRTCLRVRSAWHSTRNLRNVHRHLEESRKWLYKVGNPASLAALDRAMLDIYVSANALDEALGTIAKQGKVSGLDAHCVATAAVLFAKKGAWELLDRLLVVAKESRMLDFNAGNTRKFNNTIHLYARQHTTTESWKFVTAAVDNLGFSPNQATSEIMLQSFVTRSAVVLIPKWLRYVHMLGSKFALDARVAAKLLLRFYRDHRPSHVMMMWFCRNLVHAAPSLAGSEFFDLVKEAIGHDIKHTLGTDETWRRSHATARAGLSDESEGVVPSPGWEWNQELHFVQPDSGTTPTSYSKDHDGENHSSGPERDMMLAMSLLDNQKALDLYSRTLDTLGLPASPMALELAVEASLRKNRGDRAEAEAIIADAKTTGMNVTCAMGPLLLHQTRRLRSRNEKRLSNLRTSVIDYYKMNEENGWPVKHHVGVNAANVLIRRGQPKFAIDVLSTIYQSDWAIDRPLDITAMTVFLRGYVALKSLPGIRWTIKHVLEGNMRIDQVFLHTLKDTAKKFREGAIGGNRVTGLRDKNFHLALVRGTQQCYERRAQQMLEAKLLGKKLVACLARCANEKATIDISVRRELEDSLFGERTVSQPPAHTLQNESNGVRSGDQANALSQRPRYLERRKAIMAKALRAERVMDKRQRRHVSLRRYDTRWLRQYRAFLRHNLVIPGGKLASFRYRLADDPEDTLARKQRRRAGRLSLQREER